MNLRFAQVLFSFVAVAALAACGGGGGGSSSPVAAPATTNFPIKAAVANSFKNSVSLPFKISGASSGVSISGNGTVTRGTPVSAVFEGGTALKQTSTITGAVLVGTTSVPLASVSNSFTDTNYNPLGSIADGEYSVIIGVANIPVAANINDTGTVYTANTFTNSTKSVRTGTTTVSFALQPDTSTTGLLKVISVSKDLAGTTKLTSTLTIRVDAIGSITYLSEAALYPNGDTLTLTY